jgi:hypothetical protein
MLRDFETNLESSGWGTGPAHRVEMARDVFEIAREQLYLALASAPDILFVGGTGNADNAEDYDDSIPPSFDLPNLIIVGAVDQAGEPRPFTSAGKTVAVFANGFEVESYVPGGRRLTLTGNTLAPSQVTNLAAKLLAIDPSLTPGQIIDLIKKGADDIGKNRPILIINPKRSITVVGDESASG